LIDVEVMVEAAGRTQPELLTPWIEAAFATALALGGYALGRYFSKQRAPWWMLGEMHKKDELW
jgi:hypothetical protein